MTKHLLIFLCIISINTFPVDSFLDVHGKQVIKELGKWSEDFRDLEHLKTVNNREYYKIIYAQEKDSAILVLSEAQGRFDKFDLMTVIVSGRIDLIRILKYRSEYGSEVTNKKWLAQFYTKPDSIFVFRKNIDAISGATFSSQGLIEEINQINHSIHNASYR